jgi:WD40 repeat protein
LLQNSRYLASGSEDSSVHIWDLKNKKIFKTFPVSLRPLVMTHCTL